jgi:hypothetical protein
MKARRRLTALLLLPVAAVLAQVAGASPSVGQTVARPGPTIRAVAPGDSAPAVKGTLAKARNGLPGPATVTARHRAAWAPLWAPAQTSPPNGVWFDHYPRTTTLTWRSVPGAVGYVVDRQYCSPSGCWHWYAQYPWVRANTPAHTYDFVGAQWGRWRVWAIDSWGYGGYASPWYEFRYSQ